MLIHLEVGEPRVNMLLSIWTFIGALEAVPSMCFIEVLLCFNKLFDIVYGYAWHIF